MKLICTAMIISAFIVGVFEVGEPDKVIMTMIFGLSMYIFTKEDK